MIDQPTVEHRVSASPLNLSSHTESQTTAARSAAQSAAAFPRLLVFVAPPALATAACWIVSKNSISPLAGMAAFLVLAMAWGSFVAWRHSDRSVLPLFAFLAFAYWIYYAVPLFFLEPLVKMWGRGVPVSPEGIELAMVMVAVGLSVCWVGMRTRLGQRFSPSRLPDIADRPESWSYVVLVLVALSATQLFPSVPWLLGEGGRQFILILQTIPVLTAIVLLTRRYMQGTTTPFQNLVLFGTLAVNAITGLASGWLGQFGVVILLIGLTYFQERKTIPIVLIGVVALLVLFLQPGKEEFRRQLWAAPSDLGIVERAANWLSISYEEWQAALSDPLGPETTSLAAQTLERFSLLAQSANVFDRTPDFVSFQEGASYSYFVVSWVPRFIWPEKPSVSDANRYYQVAYGLTPEEQLGNVAIAVGVMTESYMNFGWYGVIALMFLLGIFYAFFQHTFLSIKSGMFFGAIGLVQLTFLLTIESQLGQYLGGFSQQIVVTLLVFSPILARARVAADTLERGEEPKNG